MIIVMRETLLNSQLKYCGLRPKHIPYESVYSILCRFSLFNVISGAPLVKLIHQHCGPILAKRHHSKNLSRVESLRVERLQELLGLQHWQVESMFLPPTLAKPDGHVASVLRFCPTCLAQGRHYTLFQFELVNTCPVHGIGLLSQCRQCAASTSFELHAQLFKHPYGCWRCGRQLGAPRDPQSLNFISARGAERLRQAHRLLGLEMTGNVAFDITSAADFQCDNVLQLSQSIQQFARVEVDLFRELQRLACDPSLSSVLTQYPQFRPPRQPISRAPKVTDEALASELASIVKSIFRHVRKINFPYLRLTDGLLTVLWRDIQGISVPSQYYKVFAYLDWLSYWRQIKVPCELRHSAPGCQKRMLTWIEEKKKHSGFQRANSSYYEHWWLRQLLACDITTLLSRQSEQGLVQTDFRYQRLIHPVCWAAFFSESSHGKPSMTFISALSWQASRKGETTTTACKPLRRQEWVAMLRSLEV